MEERHSTAGPPSEDTVKLEALPLKPGVEEGETFPQELEERYNI